ncbi:MAG: polysaccharide biosynthesis/export family protein, partial [Candidatus Binatia bacterium]
ADSERLRIISLERSRKDAAESYLIGAGDLLEINVFDLAEMNRRVRVASSGYVQLPLIGAVKAAGRSETDLSADIAKRLARNYLQDPQVDVFVEEYKSQQVAVTGSVSKPGLYPLTRERYTILDMISEAGGLTKEAGAMIQFIPAVSGKVSAAFEVASASERIPMAIDPQEPLAAANAIPIDLNDLLRGGNRAALNVPVAAGDVIFVPEAGSFTIEGWVDKPGTYPLTRNTTVLAALSSGGGALFPSRLGKVQVLRARQGSTGPREVSLVDLNAIREGQQPDVPLRSGDIVRVPAWNVLIPPWSVYALLRDLIRIGASVPII